MREIFNNKRRGKLKLKKVLFKNSNGIKREIAKVTNMEEAYEEINKFCSERNFEIFYTRSWKRDATTIVDVGSHTEFFYIED